MLCLTKSWLICNGFMLRVGSAGIMP